MTNKQVAAWAQSAIKVSNPEMTRVIVAHVRVNGDCVQKVRFTHRKARHVIVARTTGLPVIQVRADGEKFIATALHGSVAAHGKTAAVAFARAAQEAWAN